MRRARTSGSSEVAGDLGHRVEMRRESDDRLIAIASAVGAAPICRPSEGILDAAAGQVQDGAGPAPNLSIDGEVSGILVVFSSVKKSALLAAPSRPVPLSL